MIVALCPRDEILTAVKEDKRVLGFLRECKEEVLRDLMVQRN